MLWRINDVNISSLINPKRKTKNLILSLKLQFGQVIPELYPKLFEYIHGAYLQVSNDY